jgi:hypothetical protein
MKQWVCSLEGTGARRHRARWPAMAGGIAMTQDVIRSEIRGADGFLKEVIYEYPFDGYKLHYIKKDGHFLRMRVDGCFVSLHRMTTEDGKAAARRKEV